MAWAPDYCTVAELKTQLRITDATDDVPLAVAVTAASRALDHECDRQFGVLAVAAARVYSGVDCVVLDGRVGLRIDDLMSTVDLAVSVDLDNDGTPEQALVYQTDFDLWPINAAADGVPWDHLTLRPTSACYNFPRTYGGVSVTALFGWTAVPTVVKQATLIQSARFFTRRDAAFGIAGSPELGSEVRLLSRLDPDVALMLTSVVRPWGAVS